MNNSKLYVGNLTCTTRENELQTMFAAHGEVLDVKMPLDRDTGNPKGFAFVTMASSESAQAAIIALNGRVLEQRNLIVSHAKSQEDRPAFNSSGRDPRRNGNSSGGRRRF
jgi:RNA recognition motif-containing protein